MDQLPQLGKRELICLLLFTCNYVVFVWRGFLFLWVLGMGYVILLWHSLSLPYNYFLRCNLALAPRHTKEVAYKTLVHPPLVYAAPISRPFHETQIAQVEKVQGIAARWTCRRWRNTSSVGDILDEIEWPSQMFSLLLNS